jgi:integrase/recombinase XerC
VFAQTTGGGAMTPADLISIRPPIAVAPASDPDRLLEAFYAGRNARTLAAYRADLESFCHFVGAATPAEASRRLFSVSHGEANGLALAYRARMTESGLQGATINRRLAALRSLVKLANTLGLISWTLAIENVKIQSYRDTRGPSPHGFKSLLATASEQEGAKRFRDVALLHLLHDLGLRRGEVVGLDVADFDVDSGRIAVLGKARSQKEFLTLPEQTKGALTAWLELRGTHGGPLFTNFDRAGKGSGRLTGAAIYHIVRKLGSVTSLTVRPHGLRHLAITTALDLTNGDMRSVQKFSRHRDVRILTVYDDNRLDLAGQVARLVAGR